MWNEIRDDKDLKEFMKLMNNFHDSCVKEMRYYSGAYVNSNLSMYPVNDKRELYMIIQRQYEEYPVIEMKFTGLKYLKLFPIDEKYTCEILDSAMILKDNEILWCDSGEISENDMDSYEGIIISAKELRWRPLENGLGSGVIYKTDK